MLLNGKNQEKIFIFIYQMIMKLKDSRTFTNVNIIKKKINHGFIIGKYVIISEFDIDNIKEIINIKITYMVVKDCRL